MLTTQSLTVMRQQKTLLHNINVTIDKGKIYALIGHNGSGKSTLIKALAGETPPTSGQILLQDFADKSIFDLPPKTFAQQVPHCQNSCHPHLNNPNGEKGDNHGTIQCRTQTGYTKQTFIT